MRTERQLLSVSVISFIYPEGNRDSGVAVQDMARLSSNDQIEHQFDVGGKDFYGSKM